MTNSATKRYYPNQSAWSVPVAQVGMRPGQSMDLNITMPAPSGIGDEFYGIPEGSDVAITGRFDSIDTGLIFTGSATAQVSGECGRCLTPINRADTVSITTLMPYSNPDENLSREHRKKSRSGSDDEDIIAGQENDEDIYPLLLDGSFADFEAILRDNLSQSIPVTPLCKPDCLGLCSVCGINLNENPDHTHDEIIDGRFEALRQFKEALEKKQ